MTATILDEFEQDLQASATIPHCQIINPPNLLSAQLEKFKPPFGFFIPKEKAEQVGFQPTLGWELQEVEFQGGAKSEGYLATQCRMVIVHRSTIEVQGLDEKGRYYYLGNAYQNGQITDLGQQAKSSPKVGTKPMFRTITRMLLFFLDKGNGLLHKSPLQFTSRGGFGGSFGMELREYHDEINRVFGKLRKKSGMSLSPAGLARVAIDFELGYHKAEDKAPFVCVKSRLAPAIDQVGVVKSVERRGYSVQLKGVPIEELLISSASNTGNAIMEFYKQYEKFPLPMRGQLLEPEPESQSDEWVESPKEWDGEF